MRATRCAAAPGGLKLIACFSQEGQGSWVCRVHIKVLCLRNCTLNVPATCTHHHAPQQGYRTCSRPLQQHLYLPELITHPAVTIKNLLCSHIKAYACYPKTNRERYTSLGNYIPGCCFCRHFPWADGMPRMWSGPLRNL